YLQTDPYYRVLAKKIEEVKEKSESFEYEVLMRTVLFHFEQYVKKSKKVPSEVLTSVQNIEDPGRLADIIAAHLNLKIEDKQKILESVSHKERLEKLCSIIIQEVEILDMERKIHIRVRRQMEKAQK